MKNFLFVLIFFLPMLSFGQWVDVANNSQDIYVYSQVYQYEIPVTKGSDTVSFEQWLTNLKENGMPDLGYTVDDISELFSMDQTKLSEAYNAACAGCTLKRSSIPEATIEFPEMNFLYRGYDNVFKFAANFSDGVSEYRVEATDATVKTITRNNKILHTINPKGKTSEVKVIYKSIEGKEQTYGPWFYKVKAFPKPIILTESISKLAGGEINFGMPEESLFDADFQIRSIEIDGKKITGGNSINPDLLKKVKIGKIIPIKVTGLNLTTDEEVIINGAVKVIE